MKASGGVDQLRVDPDPVRRAPDTTFQHVADTQVSGDLLGWHRPSFVLKHRMPGRHGQARQLRQIGDQILGETVAEVFLLRVAGEIVKRQHGNRGSVRQGRYRSLRNPARGRAGPLPRVHRLRDILDLLLAQIFEGEIEPTADHLMDDVRDADAPWRGETLEP
jgi:hypothetical protein